MRLPAKLAVVLVLAFAGLFQSRGADNPPAPAPTVRTEDTNAQEILRTYLHLQEQLHAAQLAIEENRKENAEAAAKNSETLTLRLQAIETALSAQRARELEALQSSNRVMLIIAGSFAFVGVAAMLLMAFFQWRTVHGLAAISAGVPPVRLLGPGSPLNALGTGELPVGMPGKIEQSNARLIGALEKLEQRIYQLESATRPASGERKEAPAAGIAGHGSNGNGEGVPSLNQASATSQLPEGAEQINQLIRTGQALLDQDKPEGALACFDEALALNPRHGDALVKKGTVLERLQKLDEAIACYDAAIAADGSLTIAYLHKAGLFNRLEKFSEALQCYEKALSTQEKRAP